MHNTLIDLYSDTRTRPTVAMRRAMAEAEVGDEQASEDPTVNELVRRVALLLGKEDAVFLPSGTMCNEIAILVHCRAGDEIITDQTSHIINFEGGAPAALAGAMIRPVVGRRGIFGAADVEAAIRPGGRHAPPTRLVEVEQTANLGGGAVWPKEALDGVTGVARRHGLATHMDGARLMNAVVASGIGAAEQAAGFDSVWIDFSKGLGCPVGVALAGSKAFIAQAWRWKQRLGGAMRQAGIIAAAGLYALDHHVTRLADDHAAAQALARGLAEISGIVVEPVDTNIVYFNVSGTGMSDAEFVAGLSQRHVRMGAFGGGRIRAVTHLDVPMSAIPHALAAARAVAAARR
ncbi:MAG: low specificity L-threonine aldolase [Alphaproteobacteria bacterium]|nr:low specificity L-threonine aldolase [Alphaproteobacteria bacterium]